MDSGNSESLQSSSEDHISSPTYTTPDHSSFYLPPSSSTFYGGPSSSSSSATYQSLLNNNLIPNNILNQTHLLPPPPPPRNPRKRTRASRKAPTTILTTDTSNFKTMVQEFTGVSASPFATTTRRFDLFRSASDPLSYNPFRQKLRQSLIPSSSLINQYHHSMNFPDLPFTNTHQVSTFQPLLSHQHHDEHYHHQNHDHIHQTVHPSLEDLEPMNPGALQQHQNPTPDDDNNLMMRRFSEFNRRPEKLPEIHNNAASSSSPLIKDSSGITMTTTTTVDPWICPTDSNN